MSALRLHNTSMEHWHALIQDAEHHTGICLDTDLQSYLIITLDYYLTCDQLASSIIALDFFESTQQTGKRGCQNLRTVGDYCLLLAGLFPERAYKKNVTPNYFIRIGEQAYRIISVKHAVKNSEQELFYQLSHGFVDITDVLSSVRNIA